MAIVAATPTFILITVTISLCGCTSSALQSSTVAQGGSASSILEEMVLSNLEAAKQDPDTLPWHLKITSGSIVVNDTATPSFTYTWPSVARTLGITGSREWQLSWSVTPVVDYTTLSKLQSYYQNEAQAIDFKDNYREGLTPPLAGPHGHAGLTFIWPRRGSIKFQHFLQQILDAPPVTASDQAPAGYPLTIRGH